MSRKFNCPLCQQPLAIMKSKKDKPYITCPDCGLQMFVRYPAGITRMERMAANEVSFLDGYVVCQKCKIAVKDSPEKIKKGLLTTPGIYCPECDQLLVSRRRS